MIKKIVATTAVIILAAAVLIPVCETGGSFEETLDVMVIAGQSNGAYMETTTVSGVTNTICDPDEVNGAVDLPKKDAYYYGTSSVPILYGSYYENPSYDSTLDSYGIYSMTSDGEWTIGGEEAAIASAVTARSYNDILIINVCAPGAPISFFAPDATGGLYAAAVIDDALDKVSSKYTINKLGFVWIQGESNKTTAVDTYIAAFEDINDWYVEQGFPNCYMVQTKPSNSGYAAEAQLEICETISNCILSSTAPSTFTVDNGLLVSDNLHYSQDGRNVVGSDIGAAVKIPEETQNTLYMVIAVIFIAVIVIGAATTMLLRRD